MGFETRKTDKRVHPCPCKIKPLVFVLLLCLTQVQLLTFEIKQADASPALFSIGDVVRTTYDLYVRNSPGLGSGLIWTEHANTAGVVLGGPQTADGYTWWRIRYDDDVEGWSSDHNLEKFTRPSPKFNIGDGVQTTGELHVRVKPGLYYSILKTEPIGAIGTILDFPTPRPRVVDDYNWWKIRYSDGTEGWSSDHRLEQKPNQKPTCSISANPRSGREPLVVTFSMSASDPDGSISAWVLDVDGDGNADYQGHGNPPSIMTHRYTSEGSYSVMLVVSDDRGETAFATETVNVGPNQPPTCSLSADIKSGAAPLTVTFTISASDPDGYISAWALRPGDGSPDYSGPGVPPPTQTHTYEKEGSYTAILMISDDGDLTASHTEAINVIRLAYVRLEAHIHPDQYRYPNEPPAELQATNKIRYQLNGELKEETKTGRFEVRVDRGTEVTLTKVSDPEGYIWHEWDNCGFGRTSNPTITIRMDGDRTAIAYFTALDTTPPSAVTDLAISEATKDSITLTWTAPGDDRNVGRATKFDIRNSTSPINDANWKSAIHCEGEPAPQPAGNKENYVVVGLSPQTTYYFALKTADEVPNWSGLSNIASGTTERASELKDIINRRIRQRVDYPDYLLGGEISTVWMKFTDKLMQTDLIKKYDEFYWTGIDYDCLRLRALIKARDFLGNGDVASAEKYLRKAETYEKLSGMSFDAAVEVFNGNLDSAETLAKGIKDGCDASLEFAELALLITNPAAALAADYIHDAADYAALSVYLLFGEEEAKKKAAIEIAVKVIFNEIQFEDLGDRTVADYTKNRIGKVTFSTLQRVFRNEKIQYLASKIIKEIGADIGEEVAKEVATRIWDQLKRTDDLQQSEAKSPVELRVYDSQGRITGLLKGKVANEILGSVYYNETVTIFYPLDSYNYELEGTENKSYGLVVSSIKDGKNNTFTAIDIPISTNVTHRYAIDWDALSKGEEATTLQIDSDGDGVFEQSIKTGTVLQPTQHLLNVFYVIIEDVNYPVTVYSNSTVSKFSFRPSVYQISFEVSGETGFTGYCNASIPKYLFRDNPWTVKINGKAWNFIQSENATHSFLYFTYEYASTLQIVIKGTWAIPEFPDKAIPILTFLAVLVTIQCVRKRRLEFQYSRLSHL